MTETTKSTIWVVSWIYYDRSGSGLIRAFESEEKARDLLKILNENCDNVRSFCLDKLEIEKEYV